MAMKIAPKYRLLVWIFIVIGILITTASSVWELNQVIWWMDNVVHFYNFYALTLLVTLLIYRVVLIGAYQHSVLFVLTAASVGLAMGVLWEIIEWIYDQIVNPDVIKGKAETLIDLMLDFGGSLLAGGISLIMLDKPSESEQRRRNRWPTRRAKPPRQSRRRQPIP